MRSHSTTAVIIVSLLVLSASSPAPPAGGWDARAAEHLYNRAGFGATTEEVAAAVQMGRAAFVEQLLEGFGEREAPAAPDVPLGRHGLFLPLPGDADPDARRELLNLRRPLLQPRLYGYVESAFDAMVEGKDPLRDKLTLFWHGLLVSGVGTVRDPDPIIEQHAFLLENALGSFEVLLRGIARDPAMLRYLDNRINSKSHPNENWARELLELFSLGVGNYTEDDIKEAARAFSGWTDERRVHSDVDYNAFRFRRSDHDFGQKTVLGVTGRLDGDDVIDVILAGDQCGRWIAYRLIEFFEGVAPEEERLEEYASFLRENGYDVSAFMRKLFNDERFYRDEIVGQRVAGPIDFLVGSSRRLGVHAPGVCLWAAGEILGQRLLDPPGVKGWEEGLAWLNTSTMLHRSNLVGVLLGLVDASVFLDPSVVEPMRSAGPTAASQRLVDPAHSFSALEAKGSPGYVVILDAQLSGWKPDIDLCAVAKARGATSDAQIAAALADELLAVPLDPTTLDDLIAHLAQQRGMQSVDAAAFLDSPAAERTLRGLAHLMLSAPEAQFH